MSIDRERYINFEEGEDCGYLFVCDGGQPSKKRVCYCS